MVTFRIVLTSLAVAVAIVSVCWVLRPPAGSVLFTLFWPSVLLAILISGNPHSFSSAVVFAGEVVEVLAAVLLFVLVVRLLRRPRTSEQRE